MTSKPKVKRFRIPRAGGKGNAQDAAPEPSANSEPTETPANTNPAPRPDVSSVEAELASIRAENLTGRQLRMARRMAEKRNLSPQSDEDAVRLLRLAGIDPFNKKNVLDLMTNPVDSAMGGPQSSPKGGGNPSGGTPLGRIQLPQKVDPSQTQLPSTEASPVQQRIRAIEDIRKELVQRRKRKLVLLIARLAFFIGLPTLLVGWYFSTLATPFYSTKSEFLILQADGGGGAGGGLGGLLSGTQFATSQDSIAVQSYLQSKDAMLRLNKDAGFRSLFEADTIDPIQRLSTDASSEAAHKVYKKNVKIGFDPTEGVIRMQVTSPDPVASRDLSVQLIQYAEERVNTLSEKKRRDQMADSEASFEKAKAERKQAQDALVELQVKNALLDPDSVIAGLRGQINSYEIELQEKKLELAALNANPSPNQARVRGVEGDITRLEAVLVELNQEMTDASQGENSLASLSVRLQIAQSDLAAADLRMQTALEQMEQTRAEASRQVRYLTTPVIPIVAESASYPKVFEDTLLAFLIFSGVYLLVSLTASILREQVTA